MSIEKAVMSALKPLLSPAFGGIEPPSPRALESFKRSRHKALEASRRPDEIPVKRSL